ncbi:MAG: TRAP transporter small permease [Clostridiales bacterium]|nr:TRAP transporter small permease [Clostridiales bacterium]
MKIIRWLDDNFEKQCCILLLAVMTFVTSLQVICRIAGIPLSWSEEVARFVFVWIIYLSCSYAVKEDKHIKIDAVLLLFKERGKFALRMISNLLFLVFAVVVSYQGAILVSKIVTIQHQTSPALGISMGIPYSSFVIGCMLMSIRLIQSTYKLAKEERPGLQEKGGGK